MDSVPHEQKIYKTFSIPLKSPLKPLLKAGGHQEGRTGCNLLSTTTSSVQFFYSGPETCSIQKIVNESISSDFLFLLHPWAK